nr:MAG TPA: hypothetical protein [Caudoviricetes sp.]
MKIAKITNIALANWPSSPAACRPTAKPTAKS